MLLLTGKTRYNRKTTGLSMAELAVVTLTPVLPRALLYFMTSRAGRCRESQSCGGRLSPWPCRTARIARP